MLEILECLEPTTCVTIDDGLIVFGCHLLIPAKLQQSALRQLHAAHQGTIHIKLRARQGKSSTGFGINDDIDNVIFYLQAVPKLFTIPSAWALDTGAVSLAIIPGNH